MSQPPNQVHLPTPEAARQPVDLVPVPGGFNPNETAHFQAKMPRAPAWFSSFLASNRRETQRFRDELAHIKSVWPLLMKERRGGKWTDDDKLHLKNVLRAASSVSPYLAIWAIPGSMALLPFLAWYLDRQRQRQRKRKAAAATPSRF